MTRKRKVWIAIFKQAAISTVLSNVFSSLRQFLDGLDYESFQIETCCDPILSFIRSYK